MEMIQIEKCLVPIRKQFYTKAGKTRKAVENYISVYKAVS